MTQKDRTPSNSARIPFELDVVEVLSCAHDIDAPMLSLMMKDIGEAAGWRLVAGLAESGVVEVWLPSEVPASADWRRAEPWEIAVIVRAATGASQEVRPQRFQLRPGPRCREAYNRDFGAWCDKRLWQTH